MLLFTLYLGILDEDEFLILEYFSANTSLGSAVRAMEDCSASLLMHLLLSSLLRRCGSRRDIVPDERSERP